MTFFCRALAAALIKQKLSRVVTVSVAVWIGGRSENKETGPLDVNCLLAVLNLSFEVQQNCGMCYQNSNR